MFWDQRRPAHESWTRDPASPEVDMNSARQESNTTRVVRDSAALRTNLIGAAVGAAIAVGSLLLVHHWAILILAIPAGLLSLGAIFSAFRASCKADCPACGETIEELSDGRNRPRPCRGCDHFVEGVGGELWAVDQDAVFRKPMLSVLRPQRFAFPNACCVCCGPPTHGETICEEVAHGATAVTLVAGVTVHNKITIDGIPHCAEHSDGIAVDDNSHLRFRSYPFLRAFCRLNRIRPGDPPSSLMGVMDLPDVVEFLTGGSAEMRRDAAVALGYRGVAALPAAGALSQVAENDEDASVRKAAEHTLRILKGPERKGAPAPAQNAEPAEDALDLCEEDVAAI